jgi:hypothetical protein
MRFLAFALALICSPVWAQLSVTTKPAQSVITAVTIESMQLQTADGQPIGAEVSRELTPVVRPGVPAVVVFVKHDRPIDDLLVKIKSRTAEAMQIEPGVYVVSKPGRHELEINVIGQNPLTWDDKTIVVEVGGSPTPGPGPTPGPTPTPDGPAPIEGPGLRVLFIHESADALPAELQQVFYGPDVRAFLTANAIKVDGTPEWRIVDKDVRFTDPNHRFAKALARPRTSVPWLIISNGVSGYEGPFPGGVDATLALIRSFVSGPAPTPQPTPTPAPTPRPQPTPQPQPAIVAKVVMYGREGCLWCDKWKSMEQAGLEAKPGIQVQIIEDTAGVKRTHPTFVITKTDAAKPSSAIRPQTNLHKR